MSSVDPAPRRGARTGAALVAALACVVALFALPAPAQAVRLAQAKPLWMTAQAIGSYSVALTLQWPKVSGATQYEIDYVAPSGGTAVTGAQIQASRKTRTLTVRGDSASLQDTRVTGLAPNTVYCFQVRGKAGRSYGYRSASHCKATAELNRARPAERTTMVVGTYNVCSTSCSTLRSWNERRGLVKKRILEMNVGSGGRDVDVLAVQEANDATDWIDSELGNTFTKACQSPTSNQSAFVRSDTYRVVRAGGGMTFLDWADKTHGACWATVESIATDQQVVVVSLHLRSEKGSRYDVVRAEETSAVMEQVQQYAGDTPVVLAGDFNSNRSHAVDAPRIRLERLGYDDAYDQSVAYRSLPFCNSASGSTGSIRKSWTWGDHVDRVFAPRGAHIASWEVDYRRASSTRYVTPLASDHNPVLVQLELPLG